MSDLTRQTQARQAAQVQTADDAAQLQRKVYGARTEIAKALGDRIGPDRFLRALATEIRTTEHLAECDPDTVLGGLFIAAQMGLEVGRERGLVWLIPRRNSKRGGQYEASLQIGYKGWIELFYRAGARAVQWFLIREGDVFRIGSDPRQGKVYTWEQADPNSTRPVTGAVAQVVTAQGGVVWEYMTRADIDKRSTGTPFWAKWWDEMALKTVMHRLAATAPTSTDLVIAQRADETVQRKIPGIPEPAGRHLPLIATPTPRPGPPAAAAAQRGHDGAPTGASAQDVMGAPQQDRQASRPAGPAHAPQTAAQPPEDGYADDDEQMSPQEAAEYQAWLDAQDAAAAAAEDDA